MILYKIEHMRNMNTLRMSMMPEIPERAGIPSSGFQRADVKAWRKILSSFCKDYITFFAQMIFKGQDLHVSM